MYRVTRKLGDGGPDQGEWHLATTEPLDARAFAAIASEIGARPVRARKIGRIAARRAIAPEHIETHWNGKESEATANIGDWIVTSLSSADKPLRDASGNTNVYVVKSDRFPELYECLEPAQETPDGQIYRPKGVVDAIRFRGGFEIAAPWGETQRASDGWILLNGSEVYGNQAETFLATYVIVG